MNSESFSLFDNREESEIHRKRKKMNLHWDMPPVKLEMDQFPSTSLVVSECWDGSVPGTASPRARNTSGQLLWHLHGESSLPLYWFSVQGQCSELPLRPPARQTQSNNMASTRSQLYILGMFPISYH
jgi:hypothetical protein